MGLGFGLGMRLEPRLQLRCELRQKLELSLKLEQRLVSDRPHFAMENPSLTIHAEAEEKPLPKPLQKILGVNLDATKRMAQMEKYLLDRWAYREAWKDYLDAPLVAHADAAVQLKDRCDAVIGIEGAGKPYSSLFTLLGKPSLDIDYSHYKRNMTAPAIYAPQLEWLRSKGKIILADIDFVSGKTLRTVTEHLRQARVEVVGAYIGITRWPGNTYGIGESGGTDFTEFWSKSRTGLAQCTSTDPRLKEILPPNFTVYGPNKAVGLDTKLGSAAARRVARELYR